MIKVSKPLTPLFSNMLLQGIGYFVILDSCWIYGVERNGSDYVVEAIRDYSCYDASNY